MNPRAFKAPLAAAKSFAAEHVDLATKVEIRYLRPRTGNVSLTTYFIAGGIARPDRGGYDCRNGHCPVCGKVYLDSIVKQSWTRPHGNTVVVACNECAARHGWDQSWRPGVPQPDPDVKLVMPQSYIFIDMIEGSIQEKQIAWS